MNTIARTVCCALLAAPFLTTPAGADDGEAMPDIKTIQGQVAAIRGLDFKEDVPAEKQSIEDFGAYVDAELERAFPPERQEGMMLGLMRLGLISEPLDIGQSFRNAVLTQAGAHYDPKTKKFYYLMTGLPKPMLDVVASHELMHALQDQHFDLGAVLADLENGFLAYPRNDDALLAARFLIEGEATYIMTIWQVKEMAGQDITANPQFETMVFKQQAEMDLEQIVQMTKMQGDALGGADSPIAKAVEAMDDIPPYIIEPLYAAYMRGAYFTMKLRQEGGWDAISDAFKKLPESTEQALHPEKLNTKIDRPTRMTLPDGFLGDDWKLIDAAIHGEFYLDLLLRQRGVEKGVAQAATAGWDGDLYGAYRNAEGHVIMLLMTTWDTEDDAREFREAYGSILKSKYPKMAIDEGQTPELMKGVTFDERYDTGDPGTGRGRLIQRGREVFAVEGGTTLYNEQIAEALVARPIEHVD